MRISQVLIVFAILNTKPSLGAAKTSSPTPQLFEGAASVYKNLKWNTVVWNLEVERVRQRLLQTTKQLEDPNLSVSGKMTQLNLLFQFYTKIVDLNTPSSAIHGRFARKLVHALAENVQKEFKSEYQSKNFNFSSTRNKLEKIATTLHFVKIPTL